MTLILTAQESNRLLEEIDLLETSLYKVGKDSTENVMSNLPLLRDTLAEKGISISDKGLINSFLETLKDSVKMAEKLQLCVSFNPSEEFLYKIKKWLVDNVGSDMILDVIINRGILGGSTVIYKGIYKDYSLEPKVNNYFEAYKNVNELPR